MSVKQVSSGIILYRTINKEVEFFVVHPGGPYWKNKDVWFFPKGGIEKNDDSGTSIYNIIGIAKNTAMREFNEEVGIDILPYNKEILYIGLIKQNKNKNVHVFKCDYNNIKPFSLNDCKSIEIEVEHPSKSGNFILVPENDKFEWKKWDELKLKTHEKYIPLFQEIVDSLL